MWCPRTHAYTTHAHVCSTLPWHLPLQHLTQATRPGSFHAAASTYASLTFHAGSGMCAYSPSAVYPV